MEPLTSDFNVTLKDFVLVFFSVCEIDLSSYESSDFISHLN